MTRTNAEEILALVEYKDWRLAIHDENGQLFLQVQFVSECTCGSGETLRHYGRKWRISPRMTRSELVQTAFQAVIAAEEHETREMFRYRGQAVFGPHFDLERLVELCQQDSHDYRSNSESVTPIKNSQA